MQKYLCFTTNQIKHDPQLREFYSSMLELAAKDSGLFNPRKMFAHTFLIGYAKCLYDVMSGNINIKLITIDKGEKHEDKEPDNPLLRRNKAFGE